MQPCRLCRRHACSLADSAGGMHAALQTLQEPCMQPCRLCTSHACSLADSAGAMHAALQTLQEPCMQPCRLCRSHACSLADSAGAMHAALQTLQEPCLQPCRLCRSHACSLADSAGAMLAALQTLQEPCLQPCGLWSTTAIRVDPPTSSFATTVWKSWRKSHPRIWCRLSMWNNCKVRVTQISLLCSLLSSSYAPIAETDIYQQLICMVYFIHTYKSGIPLEGG